MKSMVTSLLAVLFFVLVSATPIRGAENAERPAILICSWHGGPRELDFDYLRRLKRAGFTVDYTDSWRDFSWERIRKFNAIMLFSFPHGGEGKALGLTGRPSGGPDFRATMELVDRYLEAGGGVLVCVHREGQGPQMYRTVRRGLQRFGADVPMELIRANPGDVRKQERLNGFPFFYTENVEPSPVSEGVEGVWWPNHRRGFGAYNRFSGPLVVDENWEVVLRAPAGSVTYPFVSGREDQLAAEDRITDPLQRREGVEEPPIFAIRERGPGRLALFHCHPIFHVWSGTSWFHNEALLGKGLDRRGSDFGKLLRNTFRWLAAPSMESGKIGGAEVAEERLVPRVLTDWGRNRWGDPADPPRVEMDPEAPSREVTLYRGLIGARTALSGGEGGVEDYARAAREAGLDFVVFLEEFSELTEEELGELSRECEEQSTGEVELIPGYRMRTNLGNRMCFFGDEPLYPGPQVLSRRVEDAYMLQGETEEGEFTYRKNAALNFMIQNFMGGRREVLNNIGFFDFRRAARRGGVSMQHCRLFGAAAVVFYEDGELVEDVTEQYLTTNAGTMPCVPLAVNLVDSPEALTKAVDDGDAMTVVGARDLSRVMRDGLHKNNQFQSLPVSVSSGPMIRNWPHTDRSVVYGNERFVNGLGLMDSDLRVTSEVGLREVAIYDGNDLYRRFLPGGAKEFHRRLYLSALLQKNLSVVATDTEGGKAVSFPRRCWKGGTPHHPVFCGDHVNHCTNLNMKMARGPMEWPSCSIPALPAAGRTWDGGPTATRLLMDFRSSTPTIWTKNEGQQGQRPYQHPELIFADGTTYRGRSVMRGLSASRGNSWSGWGPLIEPPLFRGVSTLTEFAQYVEGVDPTGWGAPGLTGGSIASLYEQELTFVKDMTITRMRVDYDWRQPVEGLRSLMLSGRGEDLLTAHDLTPTGEHDGTTTLHVPRGGWFAGVTRQNGNAFLTFNHGAPLKVMTSGKRSDIRLDVPEGGLEVEEGSTHRVAFFTIAWPLDESVNNSFDVLEVVRYLAEPTGLEIMRGRRVEDGAAGMLGMRAEDGAVEYSLSRQSGRMPPVSLPVRVHGLNPRWSAGLYQVRGYNGKQYYSDGRNVYRPLGVDDEGRAYLPVYVQKKAAHQVVGHPVVAGEDGGELFVQVTALAGPFKDSKKVAKWHVSVNNPTDREITTTLRAGMEMPGFEFSKRELTLKPGEYRLLMHEK